MSSKHQGYVVLAIIVFIILSIVTITAISIVMTRPDTPKPVTYQPAEPVVTKELTWEEIEQQKRIQEEQEYQRERRKLIAEYDKERREREKMR